MSVWKNLSMKFKRLFRSGYDAGRTDNGNWMPVGGDAESINSMSRDLIRHRARDLERNADYMESTVQALERNVVGDGISLDCDIDDPDLETEIETCWRTWCHPENCDITGRSSFSEILKMAVRRMMVDGGILVIAVYDKKSPYPLRLQIKEVDELDDTLSICGENRVAGGIEVNRCNRPVAYHFKDYGLYAETGKSIRIPADRVIYLNRIKRPTQIREVSGFANILNRLKDTNQFIDAVTVKERILACYAIFIKKVNHAVNSFGRENHDPKTGAKPKTLAPGMVVELDPGDEIQVANPSGQSSDAKGIVTILLRAVSSALGLSYEAVSRDMSQSTYSSSRQNLIEDHRTYKEWQNYLQEHLCRQVYKWWMTSCVLAGTLHIPDFWQDEEKYTASNWVAPGMSWIDPVKEVNASRIALETNQTTLQEIAAEHGKDWKQILLQRAKEKEFMREIGLEDDDDESKPNKK